MTPKPSRHPKRQPIPPAQDDHVRIVPLFIPRELLAPAPGIAAPPGTELTYRGGPLMTAVQVFTVFWGQAWNASAQQSIITTLNDFFRFIVASAYVDQLGEYNTPGYTIGRGRFAGTATVTTPEPGSNVTDTQIRQMLQAQLSGKTTFPPAGPNMLYFVFVPPGVSVAAGGDRSCQAFCGYHDHINSKIFYAVVPYPNCAGCLGGIGPLDALTSICSHELAEAVTDPIPPQGWYDDSQGEIGDICAWQNKKLDRYVVQLLWSNRAKACV
jgi:hypothetical protein